MSPVIARVAYNTQDTIGGISRRNASRSLYSLSKVSGTKVTQFEDLLPFIRSRVVEVGVSPLAGHIARFDNRVYFQVIRFPSQVGWTDPARLRFTFFPAADGSALTPAIDAVGRVALAWLGVRRRLLGGILGGPAARANLRRAQLGLGATWAMMAAREAGPKATYDPWHSKPWEPGDPRRWVEAQFGARRTGFLGSGKYDWASVGQRILGALEDVRIALATDYHQ